MSTRHGRRRVANLTFPQTDQAKRPGRERPAFEAVRVTKVTQLLMLLGRMAAKADQPGFVRVQRQFELAHSFLEFVKELPRLVLMLKADDGVVRVANDNHVARRLGEAPAMDP